MRRTLIAGALAALATLGAGAVVVLTAQAATTSYEAEAAANTLTGPARVATCGACSGGRKVGFVGNNSGTLRFNGVTAASAGAARVVISYASGTVRRAQLSVNGGADVSITFPSTGGFGTPGTITVTAGLRAGANTLRFANTSAGAWAPDFDRLTVETSATPSPTASPTASPSASPSASPAPTGDCSAWSATGTYNTGDVVAFQGRPYTALVPLTLANGTRWTPDTSARVWSPGGTCRGPVVPKPPKFPPPPATWQEHWFEHNQNLRLIAYNNTVAIYFDADVNRDAGKWMLPYLTRMWQYAQRTYGNSGNRMGSDRLFSIHHEGRFFGGHPSTVYDASHDFRNVSDVGSSNWINPQFEVVTHETGHVVESIAAGKHGSPAFSLWHDSKWMEFYIYDAYVALGMTGEAQSFFNRMTAASHTDDFPVAGAHWFRDWFFPLWRDHGHAQVMVNYFQLLGRFFPANGQNFARDLNWGEFVHFMSGAAGTNLKPLATQAFGWPAQWETQLQAAKRAFPQITYPA
jgi:hypothetical protein